CRTGGRDRSSTSTATTSSPSSCPGRSGAARRRGRRRSRRGWWGRRLGPGGCGPFPTAPRRARTGPPRWGCLRSPAPGAPPPWRPRASPGRSYAGGDVVGDPGGDRVEGSPGGEHLGQSGSLQGFDVVFGDDAATEDEDVGGAAGGELFDHLGEEGHVRP